MGAIVLLFLMGKFLLTIVIAFATILLLLSYLGQIAIPSFDFLPS